MVKQGKNVASFLVAVLLLTACPRGPRNPDTGIFLLLGGSIEQGPDAPGSVAVAPPVFSPPPGRYPVDQLVSIVSDAGATIYYTTNGERPSATSKRYLGPITVASKVTLRAIAMMNGQPGSAVETGVFMIGEDPFTPTRTFSFAIPMDTAITPTLVTEAYDGTNWNGVPSAGSAFIWSDPKTLTLKLSWRQLPENSRLRFTLSGLKDNEGVALPDVTDVFKTSTGDRGYAVSDLGSRYCYNSSASQPCGNSEWPGQDGDFWDTPSGIGLSVPIASLTYPGDYTTYDSITGLTWRTCSEGQSGADCSSGYPSAFLWHDSINACAYLNTANGGGGYAGRTDWRLPTIRELRTLTLFATSNPAIYSPAFPAVPGMGAYWSASGATVLSAAWMVDSFGGVTLPMPKSLMASGAVRCVAGGGGAVRTFVDGADGTVRDSSSNLVWQKCSAGQTNDSDCTGAASLVNWQGALTYCSTLNLGGRSWRLPSANELSSLLDDGFRRPAINTYYFPNTPVDSSHDHWSSTTYLPVLSNAWDVYFYEGSVARMNKTLITEYTRCVATGP